MTEHFNSRFVDVRSPQSNCAIVVTKMNDCIVGIVSHDSELSSTCVMVSNHFSYRHV